MKIMVIVNGVQQMLEPEKIVLGNLTLQQVLERLDKVESDFLDLKRRTAAREKQILEMVKSL